MPRQIARKRTITFPLSGWIDSYLLSVESGLPSGGTVPHYRGVLTRWSEWAEEQGYEELAALETRALQMYIKHLQEKPVRPYRPDERLSVGTIIHNMRVIRIFANWLLSENELETDPFARLKLPRPPKRQPKPLSDEEKTALLRTCDADKSVWGRRDLAMVLVLLDTGLRVSELISMQTDSITPKGSVTVIGKGDKQRTVQVSEKTRSALFRYVRQRNDPHDCLWVGRNGPLTTGGVEYMTRRRSREAGIRSVHPHLLRHTFAVDYLRAGGDVYSLKALMGHESLQMLMRYVAFAEVDLQEKHRSYSPVKRLKW